MRILSRIGLLILLAVIFGLQIWPYKLLAINLGLGGWAQLILGGFWAVVLFFSWRQLKRTRGPGLRGYAYRRGQ